MLPLVVARLGESSIDYLSAVCRQSGYGLRIITLFTFIGSRECKEMHDPLKLVLSGIPEEDVFIF